MYSIEFMNDSEFEQLPYRDMGDKIGVCDRNRGRVYVRKSGAKTMDALTAMHEIEHMEEGDWGVHANHQDKEMAGVYYKGFQDVLMPIAAIAGSMLIPGLAPALGGMFGGLGSAVGGGLSSMGLGGLTSILSPIGGALSQVGSGIAGGASAAQGALGIGGGSTLPAQTGYAANAGRVGQGMGGGFGIGSGTAAGSAAASGGGGGSVLGSIGNAMGAGNSLMSAFQPKPSVIQPQQQSRNTSFGAPQSTQPQQPSASVINPSMGGGQGGSGGSGGPMGIGQDLIQKIRGQFSGQTPQQGMSFGRGNTPFGGV